MAGIESGDSPAVAQRPGPDTITGPSGAPLCVLVADDVSTNRLIAQTMLRGFGCRVELAAHGQEALNAVAQGECDLVLMDVAMPVMDGIEATRRIRALGGPRARVTVVGLTAFARPEERQRCLDAGMDQVVGKPLRREVLEEVLRSACSSHVLAPGAGDAASSALDAELFAELLDGLDADQVAEVLERVVDDVGVHARAGLAAVQGGDTAGLSRACHVLKGLAGSFGMRELARLARAIEQHCREGDREAAMAAALSDLGRTAADAQAAVSRFALRSHGDAL